MRLSSGPYTRIKLFQSCGFPCAGQAAQSEYLVRCFEHGVHRFTLLAVVLSHAPRGINPQPRAVSFHQLGEWYKSSVNRVPSPDRRIDESDALLFLSQICPVCQDPHRVGLVVEPWHSLERKEGKYLSFDDARTHPGIHELSRMELDYVRNRFLVQCEDYADRILPDTSLIKTKVSRMKDVEKVAVSYLDDPFFKV